MCVYLYNCNPGFTPKQFCSSFFLFRVFTMYMEAFGNQKISHTTFLPLYLWMGHDVCYEAKHKKNKRKHKKSIRGYHKIYPPDCFDHFWQKTKTNVNISFLKRWIKLVCFKRHFPLFSPALYSCLWKIQKK